MKVILEGSAEEMRALLKAMEAQPEDAAQSRTVQIPVIVEKDIYAKR